MTRWMKAALVGAAIALGVLVPVGTALADGPVADPNSGQLTWQLPTTH